jgi:hypothetical protein
VKWHSEVSNIAEAFYRCELAGSERMTRCQSFPGYGFGFTYFSERTSSEVGSKNGYSVGETAKGHEHTCTVQVKAFLDEIGKSLGNSRENLSVEVLCTNGAVGTSEFLLDVVWWCSSGSSKQSESIALAAEIEWSSWGPDKGERRDHWVRDRVGEDFGKLTVIKCPLKLMVFCTDPSSTEHSHGPCSRSCSKKLIAIYAAMLTTFRESIMSCSTSLLTVIGELGFAASTRTESYRRSRNCRPIRGDFNKRIPDAAPTEKLNRILWRDAKGWNVPYPKVTHCYFAPYSNDLDVMRKKRGTNTEK